MPKASTNRAWYAAVLGDNDQALTLGEEALRQAQPLGDEGLVASVRQRLGTERMLFGGIQLVALVGHRSKAELRLALVFVHFWPTSGTGIPFFIQARRQLKVALRESSRR